MAAAASPSFEHPSLKEGFSDKLYRYVNEMVKVESINTYRTLKDKN